MRGSKSQVYKIVAQSEHNKPYMCTNTVDFYASDDVANLDMLPKGIILQFSQFVLHKN